MSKLKVLAHQSVESQLQFEPSDLCASSPVKWVLFFFFFLSPFISFLFGVLLIYNVLISAVQESDSVIRIAIYILFHTLFHCGLSQDVECSSPCSAVGLAVYPSYV